MAEQRIEVDPSFFSIEVEHLYATVSRGQRMINSMAYVADFDPLAEWEEQKLCGFLFAKQGDEIRRKRGTNGEVTDAEDRGRKKGLFSRWISARAA